jgi:hypothetical protein
MKEIFLRREAAGRTFGRDTASGDKADAINDVCDTKVREGGS